MSSTLSSTLTSPSTVLPTPQSSSKDFETAFGNLSASYGLHSAPSPTVEFISQVPSTPSLLSFPDPTHIVPLGRRNSVSSEATIVQPNASQNTKRDYEAAFGALLSMYGIGDHIPALPSQRTESANVARGKLGWFFWTRKTTTKSRQLEASKSLDVQPSIVAEDYHEAAFGNLSSLYGTGGVIPSIPSKRMKLFHPGGKTHQPLPLAKASSKHSQNENTTPGKDYNAAFGSLISSYGLYGCT